MDNTKRVRKENAARAPRGRPRSAAVDEAILEAALAEMAEQGYARMSVDAVASRAGVSKPTLYLRHPSKAALATAAVASLRSSPRPEPTGDTRADLVALLRLFRSGVERPYGIAMIGTVLAEEAHTPELMRLFRERLVQPRRRELREILTRARDRGELRTDADVDGAVALLVGAYYAQYLAGDPFPRDWPEPQVDIVLAGLAVR